MWDVSRKGVPDKGSLDRERAVSIARSLQLAQESLFHLSWNGECQRKCIQRDTVTGMVVRIPSKKRKNKGDYLENDPFIDWQPVKCIKQWSNVLLRKTTFAEWF